MKNNNFIYIDPILSISFVFLITIGLLMLASASMPLAENTFNAPFYYFHNQALCLLIGLAILITMLFVRIELWYRVAELLLYSSLVLLFLVLLLGSEINGAKRWLSLPGFNLQISEIYKFSFVIFLAKYLNSYAKDLQNDIKVLVQPVIIAVVASVLLLAEPDFGATVVVLLTFTGVIFLAGMPLRPLIILLGLAVIGLAALAVFTPYRFARLTSFLHPWDNAFGSGYQLTQALIAYGRGDWFGIGLGGSIQKLFFLPEAHTDFIFAILTEELGLIGALVVILLYLVLIIRIFQYGIEAQKRNLLFHSYLCYGTAFYLTAQAFISIGVNLGLLPTKGLTLPFISYGRSSLIINCMFIGLMLRSIIEMNNKSITSECKTLWR